MIKLFGVERDRDYSVITIFGLRISLKTKISKYLYNIEYNGLNIKSKSPNTTEYLLKNVNPFIFNIKKHSLEKNVKEKIENIGIVNTLAKVGGAAKIAYKVASGMGMLGFKSTMFTGINEKLKNEEYVSFLPITNKKEHISVRQLNDITGAIDYYFRSSFDVKNKDEFKNIDILHLNNLHGEYFSLFALPEMTALKPTIWTLHDENSFTGHCGFSLDCTKWINEDCVECPYLDIYEKLPFDSANFIYRNKRHIYENLAEDIILVAPSQWLVNRVKKSILKDKDIRLIYNGIDENIFRPYDKKESRRELGLPQDKKILMFACHEAEKNNWKGGEYILETYKELSNNKDLFFISLGGGKKRILKNGNYLKMPYIMSENILAKYYSASDLFIYPSKADNHPLVVLESLSCSTPVIAFNTGGIPETVEHMKTGYISKYCDIDDFIKGIKIFLDDDNLRKSASKLGREVVLQNFTNKMMIGKYLNLYNEAFLRRCNLKL